MIRLILADDHRLMQDGLKSRLEREDNLEILACVGTGTEALESTLSLKPDVLLLDINMPQLNGIEVLQKLEKSGCQTAVIMLSMHDSRDYVVRSVKSGAKGYVLKDVGSEELVMAINQVAQGRSYLCPQASDRLLEQLNEKPQPKDDTLSKRESDVLKEIVNGSGNKEIADSLHISVRTVETHRLRIKKKLGATSTAALVKLALQKGLVN
ncbi:response regulator transcription factor [Vibrio brasiliensis]|jgi:DNA-binding NarL/FixJ family response regulator|uniref:Two component LuxR family transcriptional regulator n=1 Tax=Vibrio brasiliensis LMG 20546 TaxID=945543 RepID=E8LXD7_9VIBR|nr:response regulator transcription factor [Vibrio brasiliensis]EGA64548.1 two component LuxR family transcriptional regulator [Vibrio brasiliensis LMG 20546]MCG9647731.1 response regulator transcription factor [Vibrio brasiliensis]MCG9726528.1 response regulator transcription factor [Vibrio brasiliensis]MCG9749608.1 response regulator transcription factor [Vibrio brasiliensis]MCG9781779.1 response regulator transcription factor [Vibrio brasiliensis]